MYANKDLNVELCGVTFENPFVLAAGPPTDDLEMVRNALKMGWAGAVLKTTHVVGQEVPLVYPMMSSLEYQRRIVGLGNIDLISKHGIEIVSERIKTLKKEFPNKVIISSMMGSTKEDWQSLASTLAEAGVDMIECSFSCPQGTLGSKPGAMLGQDPKFSKTVASWVKEAAKEVPVSIKITPQVADIVEVAQAIKESGADCITASNTIPALMGIDIETFVPYPKVRGKSTYSGLSGLSIKPITLRTIVEIKRNVDIPISGTGGASNWHDAVEFFLVGASNIQMCTCVMRYGYRIIDDLKNGLSNYLARKNINKIEDIIGAALPNIVVHDELPRETTVQAEIEKNQCIKCDLCYIACRDGGHQAIDLDDQRTPSVSDEMCVGCALCTIVCPVNCISLKEVPLKK